ncbi:ATP synthase subunit H [Lotmaria passim]
MSIFIGTLLFVIIAAVGAFSAPLWAKSQVDLVRVLFYVSAFCCWLSWVLVYMAQMNPLLLPTRSIKAE